MNSTWREVEPGVFFTDSSPVLASEADLRFLESRAQASVLGRARLCAHSSPSDVLHEMLICLARHCYIRPHRHRKAESALILRGQCDLVLFDEQGDIQNVQPLNAPGTDNPFFLRMTEPVYHTYLLHTDFLLFLETTPGPFDRRLTEYAPWAPAESDSFLSYQHDLQTRVAQWPATP
jgi:cupin fold WbuC family metalloprotein